MEIHKHSYSICTYKLLATHTIYSKISAGLPSWLFHQLQCNRLTREITEFWPFWYCIYTMKNTLLPLSLHFQGLFSVIVLRPWHAAIVLRSIGKGITDSISSSGLVLDCFKIGKGVHQGCILSFCFFKLYVEYIMWNARLDKAQDGIKISGRNINNLRYVDGTTLMAESKEELKSLLIMVI